MNAHVTVTGNTVRLVVVGDITQGEWIQLMEENGLRANSIRLLDYSESDFATGTTTREWVMLLDNSDTTVRVRP